MSLYTFLTALEAKGIVVELHQDGEVVYVAPMPVSAAADAKIQANFRHYAPLLGRGFLPGPVVVPDGSGLTISDECPWCATLLVGGVDDGVVCPNPGCGFVSSPSLPASALPAGIQRVRSPVLGCLLWIAETELLAESWRARGHTATYSAQEVNRIKDLHQHGEGKEVFHEKLVAVHRLKMTLGTTSIVT